jgi:hypothetical protein
LAARVLANINNNQILVSSKELPGVKITEDFKTFGIFLDQKDK